MWQYAIKVLLSAVVIVVVSELGKRSSFWAALLASLPLTSLLAFVWLYLDTGNSQAIATLSQSIFWLVLASLPLFVLLPLLIRHSVPFWFAFALACIVTTGIYAVLAWGLTRLGIHL